MSDHLGSHTDNQARARWPEADIEAARWGSGAAREAVERTCQAVALRCQRVIAMYASGDIPDEDGHNRSGSLGQDELGHVTVGEPDPTADPGTATGYRTCQFEWVDETSQTLSLSWFCTRERGHQGQHLAGTGAWVAAVHPSSDRRQVSGRA